ncbi:Oxidoreductase molybdopterin binding domain protein [Roseovarius albus]|uniref:Oxidoreductase molybdopterin binding domain protein n=1 Tax=Roseovarius albus TaxID=1247867 RepID=A0A1X6Z198_9RHOB|nr:molybdopterin-dependent oxidoreductase [Roseovarius albus]SLN37392.1 Oxidoreductase molybdopterin binding domain protein [Roseovarius albus]
MLKYIMAFALSLLSSFSPTVSSGQVSDEEILIIRMHTEDDSEPKIHSFSMSDLEALPRSSVTTSTIWTEGEQTFTGVSVQSLLEHLNVQTGQLELIAQNEYSIEAPVEDFYQDAALLAYNRNGESMSLREYGPLWLVYDYDSDAKYRTEFYYLRSIWQLHKIEIQTELEVELNR